MRIYRHCFHFFALQSIFCTTIRMIFLKCRSNYVTLLFKEFQDCSITHWIKSTIISTEYQALHNFALICSAGHSFIPLSSLPSMHHIIQQYCISRRPISYFFPQLSVLILTIPQNHKILLTPLPLTLDFLFPSVICLCISKASHSNWDSKNIYWKIKKKRRGTAKSLTSSFEYLLILWNRFVSGTYKFQIPLEC